MNFDKKKYWLDYYYGLSIVNETKKLWDTVIILTKISW